MTSRIVATALPDGATRFAVRQRRFEPLLRWVALTAATAIGIAGFTALVASGLPPGALTDAATIGAALVLFVAVLAVIGGALTTIPLALSRRSLLSFTVHGLGIAFERAPRRFGPSEMHRDEIAGPFVRVDEAIDEEASATTVMRMGGEETATALATGARATGGSADTLTWFLFSTSAASVTVEWRGFTVVLAEGLSRPEAEDLAHRVALKLDRLPG